MAQKYIFFSFLTNVLIFFCFSFKADSIKVQGQTTKKRVPQGICNYLRHTLFRFLQTQKNNGINIFTRFSLYFFAALP